MSERAGYMSEHAGYNMSEHAGYNMSEHSEYNMPPQYNMSERAGYNMSEHAGYKEILYPGIEGGIQGYSDTRWDTMIQGYKIDSFLSVNIRLQNYNNKSQLVGIILKPRQIP
jgi:hypothetical protein